MARYLTLAWEFIRLLCCKLFGLHSPKLLGTETLRRSAEIISATRPAMILRRAQIRSVYFCKWCGKPWDDTKWKLISYEDPSPRAPGEEGARFTDETFINDRRVFSQDVKYTPRTDRKTFRS